MGDTFDTNSWAAAILHQMALGSDPVSGVLLGQEHLLHRPEVIRALMVACESLKPRHAEGDTSAKPLRAGVGWSDEENSELQALFENGGSITSIATSPQRSYESIRSRLLKLGLLDDFQVILEEAKEAPRDKMAVKL